MGQSPPCNEKRRGQNGKFTDRGPDWTVRHEIEIGAEPHDGQAREIDGDHAQGDKAHRPIIDPREPGSQPPRHNEPRQHGKGNIGERRTGHEHGQGHAVFQCDEIAVHDRMAAQQAQNIRRKTGIDMEEDGGQCLHPATDPKLAGSQGGEDHHGRSPFAR